MATKSIITCPIVSKLYCSPFDVILAVRGRPKVVNGGGFVAADCSQKVVFQVDGCGVLGRKEEMILRDRDGNDLLLIRRKGSIVEALSMRRQWKGFGHDMLGSQKLVFTLKEPNSCFSNRIPIRISLESKECSSYGDFEVRGDFVDRCCSIVNYKGDTVAQIGGGKEVMGSKDLYSVQIKGGMDQAFVFGVIAVLDYINGGSTTC